MAQLTWRPIQAQQGSTRDIAIAGQSITNSFDRMGEMLKEREARLRKEATDESVAGLLMAEDEAGIAAAAQAALSGGNKRVDRRAVADLVNSQRNVVLNREGLRQGNTIRGEEILDKQGANALAPMATKLNDLLYQGKTEEYEQIISNLSAEDPTVARGVRQLQESLWKARESGVDDRREQQGQDQDHQRGVAQLGIQSRQVGLAESEAADQRARRNQADAGMAVALEFATAGRVDDAPTAKAKLYENPRFVTMLRDEPAKARAVLENFDAAHSALTSETGDVKRDFKDADIAIAAQTTALTAAANRAENQTRTPEVQAARRALGNDGKIAANDVIGTMAKLGPYFNESTAQTDYQYVMDNVPGARPEDLDAAIQQYGLSSGWWTKNVLPTNMDDVLKEHTQKIVNARNQGYTANADLDVAAARQKYESKAAEMASLRTDMGRYARALKAGAELTPEQQRVYERGQARLVELAAGKSK